MGSNLKRYIPFFVKFLSLKDDQFWDNSRLFVLFLRQRQLIVPIFDEKRNIYIWRGFFIQSIFGDQSNKKTNVH